MMPSCDDVHSQEAAAYLVKPPTGLGLIIGIYGVQLWYN